MSEHISLPADIDHPLRNQEEIDRILLEGTDAEMETLGKFHSLSSEKLQGMRAEARAEERRRREIESAIMRRELFGPPPSPLEAAQGEFSDVVALEGPDRPDDRYRRHQAARFRRNAERPGVFLASRRELDALLAEERSAAEHIVGQLPERQLEAIRGIAGFPIGEEGLKALKLVACGLKPATTFSLAREIPPARRQALLSAIEAAGLCAKVVELADRTGPRHEVLVARDSRSLGLLERTDPTKDHEAYGALMGFPASAIRGFVEGSLLRTGPDEIDPDMVMPMRLSLANWPEELRLIARWSYVLKLLREKGI